MRSILSLSHRSALLNLGSVLIWALAVLYFTGFAYGVEIGVGCSPTSISTVSSSNGKAGGSAAFTSWPLSARSNVNLGPCLTNSISSFARSSASCPALSLASAATAFADAIFSPASSLYCSKSFAPCAASRFCETTTPVVVSTAAIAASATNPSDASIQKFHQSELWPSKYLDLEAMIVLCICAFSVLGIAVCFVCFCIDYHSSR